MAGRLKDTPGGIPLSEERRIKSAIAILIAAFGFCFVFACKLFGNRPEITAYGVNKFLSFLMNEKARRAVLVAEAEPRFWVIFAVATVVGVFFCGLFYVSSAPENRRPVVNRGQNSDAAEVSRYLNK